MNTLILITTSILALSQAATVVPTESSSVSVEQSGKDYSYNIQQSHSIAVNPSHAIHQVPIAKSTQIFASGGSSNVHQDQNQQQQNKLSENAQSEANTPQGPVNVIDYTVPIAENQLQQLPSNVFYILPYNFGLQYPQHFIRYF